MAEKSKIEWTHATFNPWWGCTKVSPACTHCYAERDSARFAPGLWGPEAPRRMFGIKHWNEPLRWNRAAEKSGQPFRVFCASMADVCEDRIDVAEARRDLVFLIEKTPALTWLLLSKRPENFNRFFGAFWKDKWPKNVWAMTTVENQEWADKRLPQLLKVPAAVRGVSYEPALGPVDFSQYLPARWGCSGCGYRTNGDIGRCSGHCLDASGRSCDAVPCPKCAKLHYWTGSMAGIHWVIAGGESGPEARPMQPTWARGARDKCEAAGVPFLFKQWGEYQPCADMDIDTLGKIVVEDRKYFKLPAGNQGAGMYRVGKKAAGRTLDGVVHDGYPQVSRLVAP